MVERMQLAEGADNVLAGQKMLGNITYARSEFSFEGASRGRSAWSGQPETPESIINFAH